MCKIGARVYKHVHYFIYWGNYPFTDIIYFSDSAYIMVVDIGGGTSDVSVLFTNGPMFATVALAGNATLVKLPVFGFQAI